MWMGGLSPLGYDAVDKKLVINEAEAETVRHLFNSYLKLKSIRKVKEQADKNGVVTKRRHYGDRQAGGRPFTKGHIAQLLRNHIYAGNVVHRGQIYPGQHQGIIPRDVWEAVQQVLDGQAPHRRSPINSKHNCLLTGLLFDETGDRLMPVYSKKKERRYSYYISSRLSRNSKAKDGWRIPAHQLEHITLGELVRFLADSTRVLDALKVFKTKPEQLGAIVRASETLSQAMKAGRSSEVCNAVRKIVAQIKISPDRLEITILREGLSSLLGCSKHCKSGKITLVASISIQRRGVESKIILPGTSPATFCDDSLVSLVADAREWFERIASGQASTVREIARATGMDEGDVSRFLPLAFLAPDIVEAILNGKQPVELTAEKLKRLRSLPMAWVDQQGLLGFTA